RPASRRRTARGRRRRAAPRVPRAARDEGLQGDRLQPRRARRGADVAGRPLLPRVHAEAERMEWISVDGNRGQGHPGGSALDARRMKAMSTTESQRTQSTVARHELFKGRMRKAGREGSQEEGMGTLIRANLR